MRKADSGPKLTRKEVKTDKQSKNCLLLSEINQTANGCFCCKISRILHEICKAKK